jgi:D-alanyl-D-alanine dipeptidase
MPSRTSHPQPVGHDARNAYGESLARLRRIQIEDCGEPLVDLLEHCPGLRFRGEHPRFDVPVGHWARQTVAEMLRRVMEILPSGLTLEALDAFRPISVQRRTYRCLLEELRTEHPQWSRATLIRYANRFVAPPDARTPPPHSTGGAIDVRVLTPDGSPLEMNAPFDAGRKSAPTFVRGLSSETMRNRRILWDAMSEAGFTNYLGEWWHWSYGEPGWALRTERATAIYGPLDDIPPPVTVPVVEETVPPRYFSPWF